jgi:hypothetical protein
VQAAKLLAGRAVADVLDLALLRGKHTRRRERGRERERERERERAREEVGRERHRGRESLEN